MSFRIEWSTYRGCTIYPNEGGLLGVGQLPINKDTQLQVEQQGGAGHEREDGVQANLKGIQLWMDTAKPGETSSMNASKSFLKKHFLLQLCCVFTCGLWPKIITRSSELVWQPHSSQLSCYRQPTLDKDRKPAGHSRLITSIASGGSCKQDGSMVPLRASKSSMVGRRSRKGSDWSRQLKSIPAFSLSGADLSESVHRVAWRVSVATRWIPEAESGESSTSRQVTYEVKGRLTAHAFMSL